MAIAGTVGRAERCVSLRDDSERPLVAVGVNHGGNVKQYS